jgi:glycosyltransferase involved in cell wall biosynthesis
LAKAHVGVLPFPDEEKFRVSSFIKLFEYMAAGLPMLATRITAHTDVVGDGEYVIWAEGGTSEQLQDALRQLWQVRMALPEMGRSAAKAAHAWTWHEAAKKLHQALIDGMAQGNSKHSSKVSQEAYH